MTYGVRRNGTAYLTVIKSKAGTLQSPSNGCNNPQNTRSQVSLGERLDSLNNPSGPSGRDTNDHIDREQKMPSAKEEKDVWNES